MEVRQRRPCGGVTHSLHQLTQPGARACRQHVPGMPQVMKVDQWQPSGPESWEPEPLPEIRVPQWGWIAGADRRVSRAPIGARN
jgi:hypothetical protein